MSEAREKGVKAIRGQKVEGVESTVKSLVSLSKDRSCHGEEENRGKPVGEHGRDSRLRMVKAAPGQRWRWRRRDGVGSGTCPAGRDRETC